MPTTPTQPYDPKNPLADEEAQLPSVKMESDYQKQTSESYTKHLADQLRKDHPDIPKDATDTEVFTAVHSVETPDATPEEFWNGLGSVYGYSWKPPAEPNILQKGLAGVGDIATSIGQDITAIPKGAVELGQGLGKLAAGEMQGVKNAAFTGMSQGPSDQTQEGLDLIDKSKAHFARGGAFAAAMMASAVTEGMVSPLIEKLSLPGNFLGKLATNVAKGTFDASAFMGTYEGAREAAKTGATPGAAWNAFVHGVKGGAEFGAALGVGGTVVAPIAKKAFEAGQAAAKANTLARAKGAAVKFADSFMPEWAPPDMDPAEVAVGLIKEIHGDDVINSKTGARAAAIIAEKIKSYRRTFGSDKLPDNLTEVNPSAAPTEIPVNPDAHPQWETTRTEGQMPQATAPNGDLVWSVGIEEKPGVIGVYNITGPTQEAAGAAANELAAQMGGTVKTEISPQLELRKAERRQTEGSAPFGAPERRTAERRAAEDAQLSQIQAEAETGLSSIEKMSRKQLIDFYRARYPSRTKLPYKGTEELRGFLQRELQAQAEGSRQAKAAGLEQDIKTMPSEQLVEKIKTATPEEKKVIATEAKNRDLTAPAFTEEKPVAAPAKTKEKLVPGQALMIGRGANGSVRVIFPSIHHADLYALLGRLRGSIKGEKAKFSRARASSELDRLSKVFGMDREAVYDLAKMYRTQINEFVKGHQTYEESGTPLRAPGFESPLSEQATDPELIRRLAEKKQEGKTITKKDYTKLGQEVTGAIKKVNQETLNTQYKKGFEAALPIGKWKVVDLMQEFSPELVKNIAETKAYEPLLKALQTQFNLLQGSLAHLDPKYADGEFTGFTVKDHLGGNLEGSITGSKNSHIMLNPWSTMMEVNDRIVLGLTDDTPEGIADDLSGQLVSTLLHELSHQVAKGEAAVAGEFTRNVGHFIDILPELKSQLLDTIMKGNLLHKIEEHITELYLDKVQNVMKNKGLTAEEARVNIHDYLPVQELGLEEINPD